MEALRQALDAYYGYQNMIAAGVIPDRSIPIPEKPDALMYVEQIQEMNIPLYSGGVMAQPYLFMQEYGIVKLVKAIFDTNQQRADNTDSTEATHDKRRFR